MIIVEYFFRKPDFKEFIEEKLHLIGDLERIVSKAAVASFESSPHPKNHPSIMEPL